MLPSMLYINVGIYEGFLQNIELQATDTELLVLCSTSYISNAPHFRHYI
jgi:hypothetical protein